MGGSGSGNRYHWHRPARKPTTSSCLPLSISALLEQGLLVAGQKKEGQLVWSARRIETIKAIHCCVDATSMQKPQLHISYDFKLKRKPIVNISMQIDLTTTQLFRGGLRWWFLCPRDNLLEIPCRKRVAKLFLPLSAIHFGCRQCHRLTYASCQNSRKYGSLLAFMGKHSGLEGITSLNALLRVTHRANKDWLYDY